MLLHEKMQTDVQNMQTQNKKILKYKINKNVLKNKKPHNQSEMERNDTDSMNVSTQGFN